MEGQPKKEKESDKAVSSDAAEGKAHDGLASLEAPISVLPSQVAGGTVEATLKDQEVASSAKRSGTADAAGVKEQHAVSEKERKKIEREQKEKEAREKEAKRQ